MSDLRTAAQQALEALAVVINDDYNLPYSKIVAAAEALRAALAKPVQEPLTEVEIVGHTCECVDDGTFNMACAIDFARAIEQAHGIGGEE